MDHRVLRAEKPEAALHALATEPVAVVVSDQRMPGMLGTDLLARSREIAPDVVRILLTAFTDAEALVESINAAGIYHFVHKPWGPTELRLLIAPEVERYRLTAEGEQLVRDLEARNRELELTLASLRTARADVEREAALRTQLQRYVSPQLVDWALAEGTLLASTGVWRSATVLFADIRGFNRLIESTAAPVPIRLDWKGEG